VGALGIGGGELHDGVGEAEFFEVAGGRCAACAECTGAPECLAEEGVGADLGGQPDGVDGGPGRGFLLLGGQQRGLSGAVAQDDAAFFGGDHFAGDVDLLGRLGLGEAGQWSDRESDKTIVLFEPADDREGIGAGDPQGDLGGRLFRGVGDVVEAADADVCPGEQRDRFPGFEPDVRLDGPAFGDEVEAEVVGVDLLLALHISLEFDVMLVEGVKIVGAAGGLDGSEGDVEDRLDEGIVKLEALGGDDLAGDADALAAGLEGEATFGR